LRSLQRSRPCLCHRDRFDHPRVSSFISPLRSLAAGRPQGNSIEQVVTLHTFVPPPDKLRYAFRTVRLCTLALAVALVAPHSCRCFPVMSAVRLVPRRVFDLSVFLLLP
jgi:hypothetical protein